MQAAPLKSESGILRLPLQARTAYCIGLAVKARKRKSAGCRSSRFLDSKGLPLADAWRDPEGVGQQHAATRFLVVLFAQQHVRFEYALCIGSRIIHCRRQRLKATNTVLGIMG